jgi:hypothetical protein
VFEPSRAASPDSEDFGDPTGIAVGVRFGSHPVAFERIRVDSKMGAWDPLACFGGLRNNHTFRIEAR